MGQTSHKKIADEYLEGIKYFFLGDIGEGYVCGGIDLAAIGVFFVAIAAIIIHFNLPLWVVIPPACPERLPQPLLILYDRHSRLQHA